MLDRSVPLHFFGASSSFSLCSSAVSPGPNGFGCFFGSLGSSSGALPADRKFINLLSRSNQKGAPREAAKPVSSQPTKWYRRVLPHNSAQGTDFSKSGLSGSGDSLVPGIQPGHLRRPGTGSSVHPIGKPSPPSCFILSSISFFESVLASGFVFTSS